jgi:hypothetical protein
LRERLPVAELLHPVEDGLQQHKGPQVEGSAQRSQVRDERWAVVRTQGDPSHADEAAYAFYAADQGGA